MSLVITSLNSGSNGNCYYIGNDQDAVLVDAGISCREIETRMANLGLSMLNVKALFISHEHIDHIRGVSVLSKKFQLPVYITDSTLRHSGIRLEKHLHHSFGADEPVMIGELVVTPFVKIHDAIDPYSFIIENNGIKIGVITDIGLACERVIHYFRQCHACFLESNYDDKMLEEGSYSPRLKKRIRGGKGHLSNMQAFELFVKHKPAFMSHLLLSHLSKNNNHPDLVLNLFSEHAQEINIVIASRHNETPVFKIVKPLDVKPLIKFSVIKKHGMQMKMFDLDPIAND
jgi:phosphoribosyl 1,2-cyclic phosphodiesterase